MSCQKSLKDCHSSDRSENRMLIGIVYAILGVIYGLVLMQEDDRLWKVLGFILLVISVPSILGVIAIEISR